MRIFKNHWFEKFARKSRLSDTVLADAIARADMGLIDADLGGGLIQQQMDAEVGSGRLTEISSDGKDVQK